MLCYTILTIYIYIYIYSGVHREASGGWTVEKGRIKHRVHVHLVHNVI